MDKAPSAVITYGTATGAWLLSFIPHSCTEATGLVELLAAIGALVLVGLRIRREAQYKRGDK